MWMKNNKSYKKLTPMEAIQLVKDSIGIEAVLDYYAGINLENIKGRKTKLISCIFHQERTPSLAITPSKNVFHCFGCQAKGDVITLVSLLKNVKQSRAAYIIAEDFGLLTKSNDELKTAKDKALDKELELSFRNKEKSLGSLLFSIRKEFQSVSKYINDFNDVGHIVDIYHIFPLIDYYMDLLLYSKQYTPENRIDNYVCIYRFIGNEIYPIFKCYLDFLKNGGESHESMGNSH